MSHSWSTVCIIEADGVRRSITVKYGGRLEKYGQMEQPYIMYLLKIT